MSKQLFDAFDFILNKENGVKELAEILPKIPSKIPSEFILPENERLKLSQVFAPKNSIEVINVSNWDDPRVIKSIYSAAAHWGFFQITNHGIPLKVLENVKMAAHFFHNLPITEKRKFFKEKSPTNSVQFHRSFNPLLAEVWEWKDYIFHVFDGHEDDNSKLWPEVCREQVLEYVKCAKPVIRKLLEVLLKALKVDEIDDAKEYALMGELVVSLVHYPVCPNPELAVGAGRHSDISSITVLLQDEVGGLYVRAGEADKWVHVPPVKGALVINIGDMLQIMSNGRYKSVEHRVLVNGSQNRVSVPLFVDPAPQAIIRPLPESMELGEAPLYRPIMYSDYSKHFFSKGHDGKKAIDYAKI